jgi:ADP-ribosylglycohydrolase
METELHKKILGCLGMIAIGDALGMPCHDMTIDEIRARFGGPVVTFRPPFDDTRVHRNFVSGQITDDTILTLAVANAYIENAGCITPLLISKYLWESYRNALAAGYGTMFGPSTRRAMETIEAGNDPVNVCMAERHPMAGASNGAAMKIAPAGLVHPGDPNAAIQDATTISLPSHCTQTAIAGACAIAAGVAVALTPGADVFSVVRAALHGARKGEAMGMRKARIVPLPSVPERIELALALAMKAVDVDEASRLFSSIIGAGLPAYESIPTAIGIFAACEGDPEKCVIAGANIGNDTDTVASMAGALAGALKGLDAVPKELLTEVQIVNNIDLEKVAADLEKIIRES